MQLDDKCKGKAFLHFHGNTGHFYIVDIDAADSKKGNLFLLVHSNSDYAMAPECNVPAFPALFCIG
jgi:hypothetical protein